MSNVTDMAIFARVAELGSFTAAANALKISKSHASREVAALEARLGARLLQRTTRRISLTDVGNTYFEQCKSILEQIEEAEASVTQMQSVPMGTLRVALPMSYGRMIVMPLIHTFVAKHPQVSLDLMFADRRVDIVAEGIDLSVRIGDLDDMSLFGRRLTSTGFRVCASPEYLAEHGTPHHPTELKMHQCLEFSLRYERGAWHFVGPAGSMTVRVQPRMSADLGEALVNAAENNMGIVYIPEFLAQESLEQGRLVSILEDWLPPPVNIWAIFPHNRHLSAKVRLLVDELVNAFKQ